MLPASAQGWIWICGFQSLGVITCLLFCRCLLRRWALRLAGTATYPWRPMEMCLALKSLPPAPVTQAPCMMTYIRVREWPWGSVSCRASVWVEQTHLMYLQYARDRHPHQSRAKAYDCYSCETIPLGAQSYPTFQRGCSHANGGVRALYTVVGMKSCRHPHGIGTFVPLPWGCLAAASVRQSWIRLGLEAVGPNLSRGWGLTCINKY